MLTSPPRKAFVALAKRSLSPPRPRIFNKNIILVGLMHMPHHQIAFSHLVRALTSLRPSKVFAFADPDATDLKRFQVSLKSLRYAWRGLSGSPTESTYRLMGAKSLIYPHLRSVHSRRSQEVTHNFLQSSPKNSDLEDLRIFGILVGDLIYDDYLKKISGILVIDDPRFREHLFESLRVFFYWIDFFERNHVDAVICNSVYRLAIVGRIGIHYGCDVFDGQLGRIVRLRGDGNQFDDYRFFREEFAKLKDKPSALGWGQRAIEKKLRGEADAATYHIDAPGGVAIKNRLLRSSESKKILIAPHCFSDSAHSFGQMLFSDFYEWLRFLAEIVKQSDDDWYLKPHPRGMSDLSEIKEIFRDCSNLVFLPHDASLSQIAKEDLSLALTMRGHIAFDFPLMGIAAITCARGSRYREYGFAINAETKEDYRSLLSDLSWLPHKIDIDELREFYFMDNAYYHPNIIIPDFLATGRDLRGQSPEAIFDAFAKLATPEYIEETIRQLCTFIESNELRFRRL